MQTMTNGSPKQIEWATRIKADYLASFARLAATQADDSSAVSIMRGLNLDKPTNAAECADLLADLTANDDARWWIDVRSLGIEGLITLYRDAT